MINNVCVSCHQPMNGGVYRKPNQCPHCLTLQDDKRTAANKLILPELDQMGLQHDVTLTHAPLDELELQQKQFVGADNGVGGEPLANNILQGQSVEPLVEFECNVDETVVDCEPAVSSVEAIAVNALDQDADFDLYLEEEVESLEAAGTVCFDNVESRPDVGESLDIALNFDEVPVQAAPVISESSSSVATVDEKGVGKEVVAKQEAVVVNSESNVVNLKEKIGEVRAGKVAAKAEIQDLHVNDAVTAVEVEGEAVAMGSMKKTQYSVLPRQYESVVLTTETARNLDIEKRLDLVTSECVIGTDVVQSDLSKRKDFSRAEYASSPNALKDARKMVLDEIKKEAFLLGANTVVEVKLEYSEISRGESAMMMVVATGTAVKANAA